jgi:hypothetical protein
MKKRRTSSSIIIDFLVPAFDVPHNRKDSGMTESFLFQPVTDSIYCWLVDNWRCEGGYAEQLGANFEQLKHFSRFFVFTTTIQTP